MAIEDSDESNLESGRFVILCSKLDAMTCKDDAVWTVDLFSGGFKFSDEIPEDTKNADAVDLAIALINLLRCLWAYRVALVEGKSRPDLAAIWESARVLAPHWAGFAGSLFLQDATPR